MISRALLLAVAALAGMPAGAAAQAFRTPGDAVYGVQLSGDATGAHWRGTASISFQNTGAEPIQEVLLRLWDNGPTGCRKPLAIRVADVRGATPGPLGVDCTALPLELAEPLAPGDRAAVGFSLAIDVPDRQDRFGRVGPQMLIGNAIPLLAVQDDSGISRAPYVSIGESFYSDVGRFEVVLDTPRALALATTGQQTKVRPQGGGRVQRLLVADHVRDFAWSAGPLLERSANARPGLRVRVWHTLSVSSRQVDNTLAWAARAMRRYEAQLGPYPYPEVDVVLAPFSRFGGMEYPTLVMTVPVERAVVHELAHQWWYGLVGDDPWTAPWLDEGFASFYEQELLGTLTATCQATPWPSDAARLTLGMAWWRDHPRQYAPTVYSRGACALGALRDLLGRQRFDALMREYADAHRFGFSTTADFKAAAEAAAQTAKPPIDLAPFWREQRID